MTGQGFGRLLARSKDTLRERLRKQRDVDEVAGALSGFFSWLSREVVTKADADAEAGSGDPSSADALRLRHREQLDQMQEALRSGFVGVLRAVHGGAYASPPPGTGSPGGSGDPDDPGQRDQRSARGFSFPPIFGGPGSRPPARQEAPPPPPPPQVNVDRLLAAMDGAFASADRVLEAAAPLPPVRVKMTWAEDRELTELLQELLCAGLTHDEERAFKQIDRLRSWLPDMHGIRVVETWDEDDDHFRVAFSDDPALTGPRVESPALVLSDGSAIVRRGAVTLPAQASRPAFTVPAAPSAAPEAAPAFPDASARSPETTHLPLSTADEEPDDE